MADEALVNRQLARHVLAVQVVLFTMQGMRLKVFLRRKAAPCGWALPGRFVGRDESVEIVARQQLAWATKRRDIYLEQLYTFGEAPRHHQSRVITVAYYALAPWEGFEQGTPEQTSQAAWWPVRRLPALASGQRRIVGCALERLRNKVNYTTAGFQLLPTRFTLTELQHSYETILGTPLDKRNFRRKMRQLAIIEETNELRRNGRQRPARLFTSTDPTVVTLKEKGLLAPF
jgi:8-oxo-dGTP diphosphatase